MAIATRGLVGRDRELEHVRELVERARAGLSGVLLVRGEAGIGKTALLESATAVGPDLHVLRVRGVESEAELAFAALQQLLGPAADDVDGLPAAQADALRSAFGLGPPLAHAPMVIGAATLGLLSLLADQHPQLVLVDDVQWLDSASRDALLFALRRLRADPIAVVLTVRSDALARLGDAGFDEITLAGLDLLAATDLIRPLLPVRARVLVPRIHEQTGGNPLAMIEIARALELDPATRDDLLAGRLSPGERLLAVFGARVSTLPATARDALLVAAASDTGLVRPISHALARLGRSIDDVVPAADAGLIRVGTRIEFRHPLVRSSIYHSGSPWERRRAHLALADALTDGPGDEAIWHRTRATSGYDDGLATQLEALAARERSRGGYAAAAVALERAAAMSSDPTLGPERLLMAAEAAWLAGDAAWALDVLSECDRLLERPSPVQSRVAGLRAHIAHMTGRAPEAGRLLLRAVELAIGSGSGEAGTALVDATECFMWAGDRPAALDAARRLADVADPRSAAERFFRDLLLGAAQGFAGLDGWKPLIDRALETLIEEDALRYHPRYLPWAAWASRVGGWALEGDAVMVEAVQRARSDGTVAVLPRALEFLAWRQFELGRWPEAAASAAEAIDLARELGQRPVECIALGTSAMIAAGRGEADRCRAEARAALDLASGLGLAIWEGHAHEALGLLALGLNRLAEAVDEFACASGRVDPIVISVRGWPHVNYLEAYVRAGNEVSPALAQSWAEIWARSNTPLAAAHAARGLGLLELPDYRTHFVTALARHSETKNPFAQARTQLLFGELLRRDGRKLESRVQLQAAIDAFDNLGARPWAARARRALRATGVNPRRRRRSGIEGLTPQEMQIALAVTDGKSNREVAAALFLSPKTVEFHLTRIYAKVRVRSRSELVALVLREPALTTGAQMVASGSR